MEGGCVLLCEIEGGEGVCEEVEGGVWGRGEGMLISTWYGPEIRDGFRVLGRVWGFRGSISG